MQSNFNFLETEIEFEMLVKPTTNMENLFRDGYYTQVVLQARQIAEAIVSEILNLEMIPVIERTTFNEQLRMAKVKKLVTEPIISNIYDIKSHGNTSAHDIESEVDRNLAENILKQVFDVAKWFYLKYAESPMNIEPFALPKQKSSDYSLINYETKSERKIIYVWTANNDDNMWPAYIGAEKVGETTVAETLRADWSDNSKYLQDAANKRIQQYANTAGVPHKTQWVTLAIKDDEKTWFHDYDVHAVLKRSGIKYSENLSGNEWFQTDVDTIKLAIDAVRKGNAAITTVKEPTVEYQSTIVLRPEQRQAIEETKKVFNKKQKMLWNAKMRFGKTLSTLQLIKEEGYEHVLILTHRPIVSDSWFEDFQKMKMAESGYQYGSKHDQHAITDFKADDKFVYFASMQDLRGSEQVGGKQGLKNDAIFGQTWDLVVIDEAHEGTQTELAENVQEAVVSDSTKVLELTGTPFNLLADYEDDQVFTWDYPMEQTAKMNWSIEHSGEKNPYSSLPKVNMFTFEMNQKGNYAYNNSFNFSEFFKVDDKDEFIYKNDVTAFLNEITKKSVTNYPFSTGEFRNNLRHSLWLMPNIKAARVFKKVLEEHPVFGKEYKVINVVDKNDNDENEADLARVRNAIGDKPWETKTITLTVRKLTTGVNIPEWSAVIFLNNTSSPTSYLQAAFRAQTPYSDQSGEKTNCYVFDFAPDRALTVMAQASQLRTAPGKRVTSEQKSDMKRLLNFLPIIGMSGNKMKPFSVDSMLGQLKRVYAQKAIDSGFSDDSLYSDELLLNLSQEDAKAFADLKAIIGSTNKEKIPKVIDVNNQGLTEEEYDKAEEGKKKPKKNRTLEEEEAINKMKIAKKNKKSMISILRGISIRIPLMIYGMKVDIEDDVNMVRFIDLVDDVSWDEFMPKGVTKKKFKEFSKYYDADVFIEAGKRIRRRVMELDVLDPLDRIQELAEIFATFKNPDKETVLTPWRVVNLHLHKTIGGLSFYDDLYKSTTVEGIGQRNWVNNEVWDDQKTFLEINSKTGLYPLYIAASLYYQASTELNEVTAGKFDIKQLNSIWRKILADNIFIIAKTPMAKTITERTLAGYTDISTNVAYIEDFVTFVKKSDKQYAIEEIGKALDMKKFDVVVGNPPYQQETNGKVTKNGQKRVINIFQHFQELTDEITGEFSSLIYPGGRWIHRSGKGMAQFGLNQINDPRLKKLIFFKDAESLFNSVGISDGLSIVLKDHSKNSTEFEYEYIENENAIDVNISSPGKKLLVLNPKDEPILLKIEAIVNSENIKFLSESIYSQKLFHVESDFAEKNPENIRLYTGQEFDNDKYVKLLTNDKAGKAGRATWFLTKKTLIPVNHELIDEYQVVVSSANAGGQKRDNQVEIIDNHSAFGRSRVALKSFKTLGEAQNFLKYVSAPLIKYAFLMTDESLTSLAKKVPDILDYTDSNKFIDFSKDVNNELNKLFGITEDEELYLKSKIRSDN
ncbi:Eco57I restriction-modification methylase domain-containing protein [Periweissella ghanensis]|nr:Eco57I restriction-modification methylase domain-containing protein [Periweissella ghanensis]